MRYVLFMTAFSFIHAADLHLDAPIGGLGQGIFAGNDEKNAAAALLRHAHQATFLALERLVDLCIAVEADFLLLAGDVYNSAQSSLRARLCLRDAFLRLEKHGVGVFLAHGNHDPLKEESGVIAWPGNVTVFGAALSSAPALARSGAAVALIYGQSHRSPREEKNLAAAFAGSAPSPSERDLFRIGLLHCAVASLAGAHAPYAPCTIEDLRRADLNYWALGHVHSPRLLDSDGKILSNGENGAPLSVTRPLAAYPGSLQGLHVNEAGPRGCLWGRVSAQGLLQLDFVPLAPLRWENLSYTPGPDLADIPALEDGILRLLEPLAPAAGADSTPAWSVAPIIPAAPGIPGVMDQALAPPPVFAPELVLARLAIDGPSPLHHALRAPEALDDLRRHLNAELDGTGLLLRDLACATRPVQDLEALAGARDLAGECLRLAEELGAGSEALEAVAAEALAPFFGKSKVRRALGVEGNDGAPHGEELAALAREAALLCLELLGPQADAANDAAD